MREKIDMLGTFGINLIAICQASVLRGVSRQKSQKDPKATCVASAAKCALPGDTFLPEFKVEFFRHLI